MGSGLEHLLAEGVISEVIARLKSGKEAEVYVVRYGGQVVAAKVYKDRAHRSFKNNSAYKEGRAVRNTRSQRAMERGSKFGQAATEDAWKSAEVDALYKLHAAGVRVPTPVMFLEGVLLMELVLDAEGDAAPRLIDTQLSVAQANAAYHDMLGQLVRILSCELIHGDLSPYNVLWGAAGATIIDFPQIISASHNSRSEPFFLRDARNILGYFAAVDPSLNARSGDASEIWRAYVRRELTPDFLPLGRTRPFVPRPRAIDQNPARGPSRPEPRTNLQPAAPARADGRAHHRAPDRRPNHQVSDGRPNHQDGRANHQVSDGRPNHRVSDGRPNHQASDGRPNHQVSDGRANHRDAPPARSESRPHHPGAAPLRPDGRTNHANHSNHQAGPPARPDHRPHHQGAAPSRQEGRPHPQGAAARPGPGSPPPDRRHGPPVTHQDRPHHDGPHDGRPRNPGRQNDAHPPSRGSAPVRPEAAHTRRAGPAPRRSPQGPEVFVRINRSAAAGSEPRDDRAVAERPEPHQAPTAPRRRAR